MLMDRSLFMLAIPSYGRFNANITINYLATTQMQQNNVRDIDNQAIYDLAEKDINPHDAVLISSEERYITYINWLLRRSAHQKGINLRLSKKKVKTVSLREQLVLISRRFHPWKEDLDLFILRVEESGILKAWGQVPLLIDVDANPNLQDLNVDEVPLEIEMFRPFVVFLGIGIGLSTWVCFLETCVGKWKRIKSSPYTQ